MGLFSRKPKWQHKNWEKRYDAIDKLDDQETLIHIARNDSHYKVRSCAIPKIKDKSVVVDIARNDRDADVRRTAILNIKDESVVADFARNDRDADVRKFAVMLIKDESVLEDIAQNASYEDVRILADVCLTSDESELIYHVENSSDYFIRAKAIEKIENISVLEDVARNDPDDYIRVFAESKLEKLGYR